MASDISYDWVIAGAGVVGLAIALRLIQKQSTAKILVLEKEAQPGKHASGRNSGVLHAGLYYSPETLKAKLCTKGKQAMLDYCDEHGLPVRPVGKVLLALSAQDDSTIDTLMVNGAANGTPLELIDDAQLQELEPAAARLGWRNLYSPSTTVVDPKVVLSTMNEDLQRRGVVVSYNESLERCDYRTRTLTTSSRRVSYGHFINACGGYADRVAHQFGVGKDYFLMPFRGAYKTLKPDSPIRVNGNIYPVPNLDMPFLGVHFTRSLQGTVGIGPTACPAFGAEHYNGLTGIEWPRLPGASLTLARQYLTNRQGFRNLAHREISTLTSRGFYQHARRLVPALKHEHITASPKVGIRPQLVHRAGLKLIMDFLVLPGPESTHVLNAISPAFTCSLSFADYIYEEFLVSES